VLQRVKSFTPADASFNIRVEGSSGGKTLSGGVMGQLTITPARDDLICNLLLDGQQLSFESIEDEATKTTYTYFTIPAQLHTGLWVKQSAQSALINVTGLVDWSNVSNLTMVGPDKLGELNVWHLRGSDTTDTNGNIPAQGDIYVDQTDYHPVQVILKTTGTGPDTLTFTVTYMAYNSGLHIDLPPASRVQSS
jgi:hypothetical protein